MKYDNFADVKIEDILNNVQDLYTLGTKGQVQSIMEVVAKASYDLGNRLKETSNEIRDFNLSTAKLSRKLLFLNIVLTAATVIGAIATVRYAFF